jgi:hypothetical protein
MVVTPLGGDNRRALVAQRALGSREYFLGYQAVTIAADQQVPSL